MEGWRVYGRNYRAWLVTVVDLGKSTGINSNNWGVHLQLVQIGPLIKATQHVNMIIGSKSSLSS